MKSFEILEVYHGYLLNPRKPRGISRESVIVKAKSRFEALKEYADGSISKIYFKGDQPYYSPYDGIKFVAFLKKSTTSK